MGKNKKRRPTPAGLHIQVEHKHLYIARVIKDEEMAPGMVSLSVYRDKDMIHLSEGDEFVTILTKVPLFTDEK